MPSTNRDVKALISRRCQPILLQLKKCCQSHGDSCNTELFPVGEEEFEIYLIDVKKMCLVKRRASDCGYFTLSYVRGGIDQYRLSKTNLAYLRQERSLTILVDRIAPVVRDAINLVQGLKGTYLWVDTLCIVQDDDLSKHNQIQHMAHIYSRSFLTIVAAESLDANSKLPFTQYVDPAKITDTYPGANSPVYDGDLEQSLLHSKFGSRGWTFQEVLLSRRRLFTFTNQTILHCGKGSWYSGLSDDWEVPWKGTRYPLLPLPLSRLEEPPKTDEETTAHHLLSYKGVVEAYTQKHFTFDSDISAAFAGIQSTFEAVLGCRFHYGMPEDLIEHSILWSPSAGKGPGRRRRGFPSWTWQGWIGAVSFPALGGEYRNENSLTQSWLSNPGIILSNEDEEYAPPTSLPLHHSGLYMIPQMASLDNPKALSTSCFNPDGALSFQACTIPCFLAPKSRVPPYTSGMLALSPNSARKSQINISRPSSRQVGTLDGVEYADVEDSFNAGRSVELIAIAYSRSIWHNHYNELWCRELPAWSCMNVMLIQWYDGYAERLGVGQIEAEPWGTLHPSRKHIRLI